MAENRTLYWTTFRWSVILVVAVSVLYWSFAGDVREAGIVSKVSRVRNDLRSVASALEAYYVAHRAYPPSSSDPARSLRHIRKGKETVPSFMANGPWYEGATLTTPVKYLPSTGLTWDHVDVFAGRQVPYGYYSTPKGWLLFSAGPDGDYDLDGTQYDPSRPMPGPELLLLSYDPTNGTLSGGDIVRVRQ